MTESIAPVDTIAEDKKNFSILLVDDDASILNIIKKILAENGYMSRGVGDGDEALSFIAESQCDLIITDIRMPKCDGLHLAKAINASSQLKKIIFMTGYAEGQSISETIECQPVGFLEKPFQPRDLLRLVNSAFDDWQASRNQEKYNSLLSDAVIEKTKQIKIKDEHLVAEREMLEGILSHSFFGVIAVGADQTIALLSKCALKILSKNDVDPIECYGKKVTDVFMDEHCIPILSLHSLVLHDGRLHGATYCDTSGTWIELTAYPIMDKDENINIIFIVSDNTERRNTEEHVRHLAMIGEQAGEGIAMTDLDYTITFVNPAWKKDHGYTVEDDLIGQRLDLFHSTEQWEMEILPIVEQVRKNDYHAGKVRHMRGDGSQFLTETRVTLLRDDQAVPCGLIWFAIDITERERQEEEQRELESQMQHSKRLEAVGSLAAGIAHEINTPIQFVGDNTHFLSEAFKSLEALIDCYREMWEAVKAGDDLATLEDRKIQAEKDADLEYHKEEVPRAIEQTLEGVSRVSRIVRAMRDFSHQGLEEMSLGDINKMLESTLTVARNELKYVSDVETIFDPDLPEVDCYQSDLNQVFLNILVNAAHAIADVVGDSPQEKGKITITTSRVDDNVRITISDTGCGIPQAVQGRVFEHFFTTKAVGKGTGQGLSISRKIVVEKHGGTLTFESEENKGTTFIITLPISVPLADENKKEATVGE